jgi:outer membrane protein, multidrug efflux system
MKRLHLLALLSLLTAACSVGPKYQKPAVEIPDAYRGVAPAAASAVESPAAQPSVARSLGDDPWAVVFPDEKLQELIRTALEKNFDVRMAAARILQAEAQVSITHADEYPTVDASLGASNQRLPATRFSTFNLTDFRIAGTAAWEIDFWRKYRNATDAARATLAATQYAHESIARTLVADIATAYFQLRELDAELEISKRTLASRQDSLGLIRLLADRGLRTLLDVRQAEQLVYTASSTIPDLERQIEQKENQLSILAGSLPGAIPRGMALTEQPMAPAIPAGLPSSLLARRPDIREAEQQLIALNAEINSARARAFPSIVLTATGGFESRALSSLFTGPAGLWNFAGALAQPIFQKGKLRAGVKLLEAEQQEAVLSYEKTVQQAFREVSDGLIAYRKSQEYRAQQLLLAESARDAARLAEVRYKAGLTDYLEVLTNETSVFAAERGVVQAQLGERLSLVQLYGALGGGWQP